MRNALHKWGLPALTLFTFFCLLGSRSLNEPDEGRYSEIAREMIETGTGSSRTSGICRTSTSRR